MSLPADELKARDRERKRVRYATDAQYRARVQAKNRSWREANREKSSRQGSEAAARWRAKNPDFRLRWLYGMTAEDWQRRFDGQGGKCAVCRRGDKPLVVDHDHKTGAVRGLLCHRCNVGLGLLGDCPAGVSAALNYLKEA